MAAYTNDLRLKEIATGDESGTWGDSTNTNLELIAEAFSFGTEAITTNADTHATTIADGATDEGRSIYLKYTGTLDSACTITLGPNTVSKMWFIENATSGSQNIIISQGSGANVTIPAGHVKAVYSDGAGSGAAIIDAFTDLNLAGTTTIDVLSASGNATIGGTLGVTGAVTADAGVSIDNITIDGTEIDLSSGDLTIDVAGDIILDADGADIIFKDGGTQFGKIGKGGGSDLIIDASIADKDIFLTGTDGSSAITALLLDMSAAGAATFNSNVTLGSVGSGASTSSPIELNLGSTFADSAGSKSKMKLKVFEDTSSNILGLGVSSGTLEFHSNQTFTFVVDESEKMRLTSDGKLAIGETSPDSILHIKNSASDSVSGISLENDARRYAINVHGGLSDGLAIFDAGAGATRVFLASTGRVGIGNDLTSPNAGLSVSNADIRCTGAAVANDANSISMSQESGFGAITCRGPSTSERGVLKLSVNRSNGAAGLAQIQINNGGSVNFGGHTGEATGSTGGITMSVDNNDRMNFICATTGSGSLELIEFRNPNGTVGDIKTNGTSTSYSTSSDGRLKEVTGVARGLDVINELNPVAFNWKVDNKASEGLIAQEVKDLVPDAVSLNEGTQYYQMDYSKLVVHLIAGMKEQQEQIDALQSEIQTLKGE